MLRNGILEQLTAFVGALPDELRQEAERKLLVKDARRRMLRFFKVAAELASTVAVLPRVDSRERLDRAFAQLTAHVECLWDDACELYRRHRYASSLFFSVVGIEELGKVSVARIQAVYGVPETATTAHGKGALRHHRSKHILAACAGAVINSRMDRIVGEPLVLEFLKAAESGRLEQLRQSALYYEMKANEALVPDRTISRNDAAQYLVVFGELLAEVGNTHPADFERQLKKVEALEAEIEWTKLRYERVASNKQSF